jgi:hypothetical protein
LGAIRNSWPFSIHPANGGRPDGLNWLTLDENARNAYVCGFVEGLLQGHCFTTWGLPGSEPNNPAYVDATRSFAQHWDRFIANTDYKQLVDGLNKVCGDERNSKIEIQHALWIAMRLLSKRLAGVRQTAVVYPFRSVLEEVSMLAHSHARPA